ncbi:MAG: Hsp33 family molecular chaperone HslO [Lachnospiraceae bacterium]|nr:Hsp33 family molecular chaperone HslO [Lachnospiraceae bacterium]
MSDRIISGTAVNNQVRFFAASTTELVEEARTRHNLSPVVSAALGRLLTAGALMGAMCKNEEDVITLQIQCSGPIGGLTVTANQKAEVKGFSLVPDVMLGPNKKGKLDVGGALDMGVLSVIKDIGLKEPYVGQCQLVTGEIAEDLTYYFATSEQIPTSVALGVLMNKNNTVKHAGGFIIQLLPFAEEETISLLEERLKDFTSITSHFDRGETLEDIIEEIFAGKDICFHEEEKHPRFYCNCSKEHFARGLVSLGRKELTDMIEEGQPIEVNCQFCGSHYHYTVEELQELLRQA